MCSVSPLKFEDLKQIGFPFVVLCVFIDVALLLNINILGNITHK